MGPLCSAVTGRIGWDLMRSSSLSAEQTSLEKRKPAESTDEGSQLEVILVAMTEACVVGIIL